MNYRLLHNPELVKMFNLSIVDSTSDVDYVQLNKNAMQVGYIVHPMAANKMTRDFIQSVSGNINSTFYQTWEDVTSKTRFELFIDQLLHYVSTYGTDFACEGNGYVPNETPLGPVYISTFRDYKVIMPCSYEDIYEKCMGMLKSGVALKARTLDVIVDYVCEAVKSFALEFNIDDVANKEAVTMICDNLGIAPNRKFDLLRYIVYKTTGDAMLIKSKATINKIKHSTSKFDFNILTDYQLRGLASIFYRFKPLFLAFKKDISSGSRWSGYSFVTSDNAPVINKIRRMAVKYHEPLPESVQATLLGKIYDDDTIIQAAVNMNNFQIIRIINTITERANHTNEKSVYIIRNGNMYVKDGKSYDSMSMYYAKVYMMFVQELVTRLATKKCYVKYNPSLNLACPTSEKNFVGDIPFGSSTDVSQNDSILGIYWRNEWGTRDFDLSMLDLNGSKIGWNSSYYNSNKSVIYSGDMTNADPEATELLYFAKGAPNGSILINRYNGNDGSKFRVFTAVERYASDNRGSMRRAYMCDPNNIKMQADCYSDKTQQMIGLINDGIMYYMCLGNGNSIVSYNRNLSSNERFYATALKAKSYLKVKDVLDSAGFIDVATVDEIPEDTTILDLTQLSRDTLVELFS